MDQMKTGKFIATLRKEKGLTQSKLAEMLDITDRAVSKWERGISLPDSSIMLPLCEILGINVNELLTGERIMENYNKKAEENLLEMTKMKEENDKRLLRMEIVMGIVCLIPLFASIIIVGIIENNVAEWISVLIIISGILPLLISTPFAIKIEQKAGYYECGKCHHKYVPKYLQVFLAPHINRTRYMKCPECHKKSWNKKVISKE